MIHRPYKPATHVSALKYLDREVGVHDLDHEPRIDDLIIPVEGVMVYKGGWVCVVEQVSLVRREICEAAEISSETMPPPVGPTKGS